MATNFNAYDTRSSRMPQQNQLYEGRVAIPQSTRQTFQQPQLPGQAQHGLAQNTIMLQRGASGGLAQKPKAPAKMPKAQAIAMANTFKRWLVVASLVGFGTFSTLAAFHQIGSTTSTTTTSGTSSTSSTTSSSSQNSGSFLQQQGGSNVGTTSSSQSSSSSSSSSTAVSGTHTS